MIKKIPFSIKAAPEFIATIRSTAKRLGLKQQALLERAIEMFVASQPDSKSKLVCLPLTNAAFAQLSDQAAASGYPGVAEYIVGEVLLCKRLHHYCYAARSFECPACHRPTADERQINSSPGYEILSQIVLIRCMWCGHEFEHDIEDE